MPERSGWPAWSLRDVLALRPAVRINQLGYRCDGRKRATWVSDAPAPAPFTVNAGGQTLFRGMSVPWPQRPDPTTGLTVHVLDFSPVTEDLGHAEVQVAGDTSHPFAVSDDLYADLARDALRVLTLLRSGAEIPETLLPGYGRPAGHVGRPPNRGDTAVAGWTGPEAAALYPGWRPSGTFDVSGGWYDAGDYGKYTVSGAFALWPLLALVELLQRHGPDVPARLPDVHTVVAECRWQLDWLLRMQVPPGHQHAGMAFHRVHGTTWSPLPGWPHEDPTERVLHRPSTTATLQLAAIAAQGARVLRVIDRAYADGLLAAARRAHRAAHDEPLLLAPDDQGRYGGGPYHDTDPTDDALWAATELWLATGDDQYRQHLAVPALTAAGALDPGGFDFDRVTALALLDLVVVGRPTPWGDRLAQTLRVGADRILALQDAQAWGQPYDPPDGWTWGSNGRLLTNLILLAVAHQALGDQRYAAAAIEGLDYLLGRNGLGQSYIVGYGTDSTAHLRTRQFGHDLNPALPPPPPGALAGGANSVDTQGFPSDPRLAGLPPQLHYLDEPTSETTNDLCIRWNAPLAYLAFWVNLAGRPRPS